MDKKQVTYLIDSKKGETASSAGTVNTVIEIEKLNINVPEIVVTRASLPHPNLDDRTTRSKSPSTKSPSTLSTVRDNCESFKSGGSPNSSKGPGKFLFLY